MMLLRSGALRSTALALALMATACGTDTDAVTESAGSAAASPAEDAGSDPGSGDSGDSGDSGQSDQSDPSSGGGDDGVEGPQAPPVSLPPEEAAAAAEANLPDLQPADDVRDVEVLSVTSGATTSLREAVTGDRPVLLWFWAPH